MYENFVSHLGLPDEEVERIKCLTPANYLGCAEKLAKEVDKYI